MIIALFQCANLGLAFLLELGMLAALCYGGFVAPKHWLFKILLGLGLPIIAVLIWGAFIAPQAAWRLSDVPLFLAQLFCFGSAVLALFMAHRRRLGITFGLVVTLNLMLAFVWNQR